MRAGIVDALVLSGRCGEPGMLQSLGRADFMVRGPYVNDMLALVSFLIVWASAGRQVPDIDVVNITRSPGNVHGFLWSLFGAASRTINDKHPFNNSSANFREDHLQSDHTSASKPDSASQDNSTELSSETSSASFPHPDLLLPPSISSS